MTRFMPLRKRALLVNCYFDDSHCRIARPRKLPYAMGPVFLAGAFAPHQWELRLHDEVSSGPLEDPALLGWPDMLVLTGVTNSFDRMLHLTAYARTRNPRVVVVAGGPAIRALPRLARRYFDYACLGDVEELGEVIVEAFGPGFAVETMQPRYDLAYWLGAFGHAETTRYCNFRCAFCSLTGEGRPYQSYPADAIRNQVLAMGRRKYLVLIDNNFYGNDRNSFASRVELMKDLWQAGHFEAWSALVTADFFSTDTNLALMRNAGCSVLFSGVESFDPRWLRRHGKLQNLVLPQVEAIRRCLDAGILFIYGLILDVTARPVADLRSELEFITGTSEITLPAFLSLAIPLPGTPFFYECVAARRFLPQTKLRDLDGTTVVLKPLDPIPKVVGFVHDVQSMRGYRWRVLRHAAGFGRRYRRPLSRTQLAIALGASAIICADTATAPQVGLGSLWARRRPRTHVTTTEPLDDVYTPTFRVASQYEPYFRPTMVTDQLGELADEIVDSGLLDRPARRVPVGMPE